MKLNPFSKVRTTSEIVATFDKTLAELKERIDLDEQDLAQAAERKTAAIEAHRLQLEAIAADEKDAADSRDRAVRIHQKIADLIG